MTARKKKKANEKEFFGHIKKLVKKFIEVETSGAGLINLIFGFILAIFVFITCIPSTVEKLIAMCMPGINSDVPWYVNFFYFLLLVAFFYVCFNRMCKINETKNDINQSLK